MLGSDPFEAFEPFSLYFVQVDLEVLGQELLVGLSFYHPFLDHVGRKIFYDAHRSQDGLVRVFFLYFTILANGVVVFAQPVDESADSVGLILRCYYFFDFAHDFFFLGRTSFNMR